MEKLDIIEDIFGLCHFRDYRSLSHNIEFVNERQEVIAVAYFREQESGSARDSVIIPLRPPNQLIIHSGPSYFSSGRSSNSNFDASLSNDILSTSEMRNGRKAENPSSRIHCPFESTSVSSESELREREASKNENKDSASEIAKRML